MCPNTFQYLALNPTEFGGFDLQSSATPSCGTFALVSCPVSSPLVECTSRLAHLCGRFNYGDQNTAHSRSARRHLRSCCPCRRPGRRGPGGPESWGGRAGRIERFVDGHVRCVRAVQNV